MGFRGFLVLSLLLGGIIPALADSTDHRQSFHTDKSRNTDSRERRHTHRRPENAPIYCNNCVINQYPGRPPPHRQRTAPGSANRLRYGDESIFSPSGTGLRR